VVLLSMSRNKIASVARMVSNMYDDRRGGRVAVFNHKCIIDKGYIFEC